MRVWDADTGQPIGQPLTGHTGTVNSVAFSPDGKRIVSGSSTRRCGCGTPTAAKPIGAPLTGHTGSVFSVAFSPDGQTDRLRQRRQDGAAVGRGHRPTDRRAADRPHRARWTAWRSAPTAKRIVSGSDDKTVRVWDAATGQPIGQPLTGHTDTVSAWRSAPTASASSPAADDKTVRVWDADTGEPVGAPLTGHTDTVYERGVQPRRRAGSSPAVATRRCGYGTRPPASRSARR